MIDLAPSLFASEAEPRIQLEVPDLLSGLATIPGERSFPLQNEERN